MRKHIKKAKEMALKTKDIEPLTEEELNGLYEEAKKDIYKRAAYFAELMAVEKIIPDYKDKRKWLKTYGENIMQRANAN